VRDVLKKYVRILFRKCLVVFHIDGYFYAPQSSSCLQPSDEEFSVTWKRNIKGLKEPLLFSKMIHLASKVSWTRLSTRPIRPSG
jgi:hypothetical protein